MAKVGFWLKGSTGKLAGTTLYKGANGETLQREIVSPSNPKTQAQQIQRIVMHTIMQAYSKMKDICDHSFEGKKKGQECMSMFMSENVQKCRAAIEEMQAQGVLFLNMYSYMPLGMKGFTPNQYLMSMGSLPGVKTQWIEDSGNVLYPYVTAIKENTYQAVIKSLGLKRGDQLTFITVSQDGGVVGQSSFNFCRVILDPTTSDYQPAPLSSPFLQDGEIAFPSVRNEGDFDFDIDANGLKFTKETAFAEDNIAACVIVSRKQGDEWARSTTYMTYPGETVGAYSLQECLDLAESGVQHQIYAGNQQYLNNAGQGGGAAAEHDSQSGGSGSGSGGSTGTAFAISSVTANGQALTVGTTKTLEVDDTPADVDFRVAFGTVGDATAVAVFAGNTQMGNDHALSGSNANFTVTGVDSGVTLSLKVKKSDGTYTVAGYSVTVHEDSGDDN